MNVKQKIYAAGKFVKENKLLMLQLGMMGAVVLTGAKIGRGSIVAAGAVVKENAVIPPNSLVAGVPAKIVRENIDRMATIHAQALKYKCEWAVEYGVCPEIGGERYHGEKVI